jgi:transcriptional regulator with GAF, ATPase, and Fis domain
VAMVSPARLSEVFVDVADTLVGDFDVIEFLQMVTAHTSELSDARAAGLLLVNPQGHLQLMAASDERAQMVELFQLQAHEGPCQDCFRNGEQVINADLENATTRWPHFAPTAVAAGYRSVHAFPMRLRDDVIGALNLFGDQPGEMTGEDARILQALADIATIGLLQERAARRAEVVRDQLQNALNRRVVIEQAKGILAHIHDRTPDEGFELLRTYCRSRQLKLSEVALAVVNDPAAVPELTDPPR